MQAGERLLDGLAIPSSAADPAFSFRKSARPGGDDFLARLARAEKGEASSPTPPKKAPPLSTSKIAAASHQGSNDEWNDNEWGPKDATKVKQMLGNFDVLVKFDLSNVQIGYDGAETLFEAIAKMDTAAQM